MPSARRMDSIIICVAAVVAVLLVSYCGKLIASGISQFTVGQIQQVAEKVILGSDESAGQLLSDKRIPSLAIEYTKEIAKTVLEFEYIPRNVIDKFVAVTKDLPEDVTIESFSHQGRDLVVNCMSASSLSIEKYLASLAVSTQFQQVSSFSYQDTNRIFHTEITCTSPTYE